MARSSPLGSYANCNKTAATAANCLACSPPPSIRRQRFSRIRNPCSAIANLALATAVVLFVAARASVQCLAAPVPTAAATAMYTPLLAPSFSGSSTAPPPPTPTMPPGSGNLTAADTSRTAGEEAEAQAEAAASPIAAPSPSSVATLPTTSPASASPTAASPSPSPSLAVTVSPAPLPPASERATDAKAEGKPASDGDAASTATVVVTIATPAAAAAAEGATSNAIHAEENMSDASEPYARKSAKREKGESSTNTSAEDTGKSADAQANKAKTDKGAKTSGNDKDNDSDGSSSGKPAKKDDGDTEKDSDGKSDGGSGDGGADGGADDDDADKGEDDGLGYRPMSASEMLREARSTPLFKGGVTVVIEWLFVFILVAPGTFPVIGCILLTCVSFWRRRLGTAPIDTGSTTAPPPVPSSRTINEWGSPTTAYQRVPTAEPGALSSRSRG